VESGDRWSIAAWHGGTRLAFTDYAWLGVRDKLPLSVLTISRKAMPEFDNRLTPGMVFVCALLTMFGGAVVWVWDHYDSATKDAKIETLTKEATETQAKHQACEREMSEIQHEMKKRSPKRSII